MGDDSRAASQAGGAGKWLAALAAVGVLLFAVWRLDRPPPKAAPRTHHAAPSPLAPPPPVAVAPDIVAAPEPVAASEPVAAEAPVDPPATDDPTEQLERTDILAGIAPIKTAFKRCYDTLQQAGTVEVHFTIAPSGRVSSARAHGDLGPTPTGACIAKAFQRAHFKAFSGAPMNVSFPVQLR